MDIFCGEIMVYFSILLLFFQELRPLTSASRTNTQSSSSSASRLKIKFGLGCSCGSCLEPRFRYQTATRMRTHSDVLDWLMYHECLSTSLLSLRIAARIMQERCRMQILYSCLWTFFVERLRYTRPCYICFFKSSGL